jgi:hypothetical protein
MRPALVLRCHAAMKTAQSATPNWRIRVMAVAFIFWTTRDTTILATWCSVTPATMGLEGIVSKRLGSGYRSGQEPGGAGGEAGGGGGLGLMSDYTKLTSSELANGNQPDGEGDTTVQGDTRRSGATENRRRAGSGRGDTQPVAEARRRFEGPG